MYKRELESAIAAARLAGKRILEYYEDGFETEEKIGVDNYAEPVTAADREASRIIIDSLLAEFPDDGILSEEETDNLEHRLSKKRVWIIDPIDGTAGFVKHDGDFSVQIGLAVEGTAVVGVVFHPYHDVLYYAEKGSGAFAVHGGKNAVKLHVSDISNLSDLKLAVTKNHWSNRMKAIIEHFDFASTVKRGSVGLKIGLIAEQTCDIYIHPSPRTKLWDACGPQVILEESGGRLTDLFGFEMRYDVASLQNHNGILATNGAAHSKAVEHLKPVLAEFGRVPYEVEPSVAQARTK